MRHVPWTWLFNEHTLEQQVYRLNLWWAEAYFARGKGVRTWAKDFLKEMGADC